MLSVNLPSSEDFSKLQKEVTELRAVVQLLCDKLATPKVVTVADICKLEGISKTQICTKEVYLLPNFGRSEYPEGVRRWNVSTYLKWREIPVKQRKDMYVDYLEEMRKRACCR